MYTRLLRSRLLGCLFVITLFMACSKSGTDAPMSPCTGITISVNGTATNTSGAGNSDGSITATASGATGFTFSLNGGTAQSSGTFNNLAAGSYTITAKTSQGCSGTGTFTVTNGDACAGKTITVGAKITNSDKCSPSGTIKVEVTGSTGFTYRLNASGAYQAEDLFNNVGPGNYTVYAKDGAGCEKSTTVTVGSLDNGPLFTAVKSLINAKCATCHVAGHSSGINFTVECTIVEKKSNIRAAAVDSEKMPQGGPALTAAEKKTITDWIDAGGKSSD
ncbi:hypothetical protein [Flavihumibacter fluvii]|uniref:hypothetical protein n=1 Tax=Flavihumibacter fluvii TaxID=2838157 RepID=UPI001BDDEE4C|nr:hypothetical protein [Flavihumibacter fluvii]ULQ53439.1 hypothetical protein KJS93_03785 [Flavihumibacter fluvii]